MVVLGVLNSRVKDFFDIWLLSRQFDFVGETLALAIERTFTTRGTTISGHPVALTEDFAKEASRQTRWRGFVRGPHLTRIHAISRWLNRNIRAGSGCSSRHTTLIG